MKAWALYIIALSVTYTVQTMSLYIYTDNYVPLSSHNDMLPVDVNA